MGRRKLFQKVLAPIHQTEGRLQPEGVSVGQPLHFVLLQKPEAPVLPLRFPMGRTESFVQWQTLLLDLQKAGHVQLPDLCGRNLEHFAEGGVARISRSRRFLDEAAPLKPYYRVYLFFREVFHSINVN